jgi:RHH-type proline utilization regulon transcriptional repressor/proline dehydrogenase/delta 1-pyrroline-5-carboxylate dehydrogenase
VHDEELVARTEALSVRILRAALAGTSRTERRRSRRRGNLLADAKGRALLFGLTDEVLRIDDDARAARRLRSLVAQGLPYGLGPFDRMGLRAAAWAGRVAPRMVTRATRARVKAETRGVVLSSDPRELSAHIARRTRAGIDCNVNLLGEAILGDDEADARVEAVCRVLRRPDVRCVSVKVSALCANLDVLAFESSVRRVVEQLRKVLRIAATDPPRLVYLDMEEYRDLPLTLAAFRRVLEEHEFRSLRAGIALQAYLPDSVAALDELCDWAAARRQAGGAAVRVRIVKGANLSMEQVEAELMGLPAAPYATKADVDANFKRMLDRAYDAAASGDLSVGVGSHNLFDVAWALTLRDARGLADAVEIEMLEGMAPAQSRAVRATAGSLLLYCPVVDEADYAAAIAYLSRRLDENAGADNFLRHLFTITPASADWRTERAKFEAAAAARRSVAREPRRNQDRRTERRTFDPDGEFANEPDTDFVPAANREWITDQLADTTLPQLPTLLEHTDDVDATVARARRAATAWAATSTAERRVLLTRAAEVMAATRGRAIGVMLRETGKTVREGDPEVSEAIDTANWSAAQTRLLDELAAGGVSVQPRGVVLVAAPWNFPYAIPANGVCSALAAGNAVLLKPAPEAVATATLLVDALHTAGVPQDVVQLVHCRDDEIGRHLVTHDAVDTVVLTGAYATAQLFLDWKPTMRLVAETSGKNALVITGGADLDLALRDLTRSAFGHAGQKCSAASLAIVEASLYDDQRFLARLADAVRSLPCGPASDPTTVVGPVIRPAAGKLGRALTRLDAGEEWLVEPQALDETNRIWSPGVRLGVERGSWFHRTECFGPVLGVMRAADLDDALTLQNDTDFGLTAGLHTLDPDEIDHWTERVEAGNLYVNRHTTGAIVRRQPFGGWKHSSVGPGAKTGGPDDILRFVRCTTRGSWTGSDLDASVLAARDVAGLRAEANIHRYRNLAKVIVRTVPSTTAAELDVVARAARVTGVEVEVGAAGETDDAFARRLASATGATRLRALGPLSAALARACHRAGVTVDDTPVTPCARIELPRWAREQSISRTLHRHGHL